MNVIIHHDGSIPIYNLISSSSNINVYHQNSFIIYLIIIYTTNELNEIVLFTYNDLKCILFCDTTTTTDQIYILLSNTLELIKLVAPVSLLNSNNPPELLSCNRFYDQYMFSGSTDAGCLISEYEIYDQGTDDVVGGLTLMYPLVRGSKRNCWGHNNIYELISGREYTQNLVIGRKSERREQSLEFCSRLYEISTTDEDHQIISLYFNNFTDHIIEAISRARYCIHIMMYNIENPRIVEALLSARRDRGVAITILTSYKSLESRHLGQQNSFAELLRDSVNLRVIIHSRVSMKGIHKDIHSSMHTKIAIIDHEYVLTGSVNWETLSCTVNDEFMFLFRHPSIALQYYLLYHKYIQSAKFSTTEAAFPEIALFSNVPEAASFQLFDSQGHRECLLRKLGIFLSSGIDDHDHLTVYISMFIIRNISILSTNLFNLLREACRRGVLSLRIIVEENTNSMRFGSYYSRLIPPNDELQEWFGDLSLEQCSIYRIKTMRGGNKYAAIHHKFIAIPEISTVICGSANCWEVSFTSEDDIVVLRHVPEICSQFVMAWYNLLRPTFRVRKVPTYSSAIFVEIYLGIASWKFELLSSPSTSSSYREGVLPDEYFTKLLTTMNDYTVFYYKYIVYNSKKNEYESERGPLHIKTLLNYHDIDKYGCGGERQEVKLFNSKQEKNIEII